MGQRKDALTRLAGSGEAKRLMELLDRQGGVEQAAKAAAGGDAKALMGLLDRLMGTKEGAALVEQLERKARETGLDRK